MKVSLRNTFKKLDKAGAKIEDDGSAVPATPAKTPKGGKRKAAAAVAEGEDGAAEEKPKKKGRVSKKKKEAEAEAAAAAEGGEWFFTGIAVDNPLTCSL